MATTTRPSLWKRMAVYLSVAAVAAGATFGATPIVVATPDDGYFDTAEFDECVSARISMGMLPQETVEDVIAMCCEQNGGIVGDPKPGAMAPTCYAPPAERAPDEGTATTKPGAAPPVLNPDVAPPPTTTTPPLLAPALAPGLAPR